ncbi:MAG: DUF2007 domain-containing protein [Bacteroidia bacterium]|nr:DUF2007 domain-containing protein [Bacteroidia bacterium]
MRDWIKVFKTGNIIDAELTKTILIDHGIDAVIVNKIDRSLNFGEATVFCPPADADLAEMIIKQNQIVHE